MGNQQHRPASEKNTASASMPGLVVANFGTELVVEDGAGKLHRCAGRRKLGVLVCGDRVEWRAEERGHCTIASRMPRNTELARPDRTGQKKVIASNIDQMLIITSGQPGFNAGLVDRYLVVAETLGIIPIIVLNKIDLLDKAGRTTLEAQLDEYGQIGYTTVLTSTLTDHGLDLLLPILYHRTSVFVGQSGVGKSSLINAILPDAKARVGEISEATGKGTHTTTTAWLYHLQDNKGDVIDSPGIREFGLWEITSHQLAQGFREFRDYAAQCRFRDCIHTGEPGCAVAAAARDGAISQRRFDSYHRIMTTLAESNGQPA
jgi:ribosome biogenesis GTPase / thiamine phosphate phosphatase